MADHDHDDATGGAERRPAVRPSAAPAPVDQTGELVQAAASPLAVPIMAAAMMRATASAMTEVMGADDAAVADRRPGHPAACA